MDAHGGRKADVSGSESCKRWNLANLLKNDQSIKRLFLGGSAYAISSKCQSFAYIEERDSRE